MDPVQSVPFCFTCKHRNPIRNSPKPSFDRMASMQMRLIDCLEIDKENNKYDRRNEVILARNGVTGLFFQASCKLQSVLCAGFRKAIPQEK